ncbi:MAG: hypothetical protein AB8B51_03210 [Sedimentitalea sp.]
MPDLVDGARRLDSRDALAALCDEIDETVLARIVSFRNDRDERFVIEVASRRVRSVVRLSLGAPPAQAEALTGHAIFDVEDPLLAVLGHCLRLFAKGTQTLFVSTQIAPDAAAMGNVGVTCATLLEKAAAQTVQTRPTMLGDFAGFMDKFHACVSALVVFDQAAVQNSSGAPAQIQYLTHLARESDVSTGETTLLIAAGPEPRLLGLCLTFQSKLVLAHIDIGQMQRVITLWNRHILRSG